MKTLTRATRLSVVCTATVITACGGTSHEPNGLGESVFTVSSPVYDVTRVVDNDGNDLDFVVEVSGVKVLGSAERIDYLRGRFRLLRKWQANSFAALPSVCGRQALSTNSQRDSVQRQGVSVQMTSPAEIVESGMTGLVDVDLWVSS